nr:hypothetical protein [Tanacetum cinerariifolium]
MDVQIPATVAPLPLEEGQDAEDDEDELYRDVNINLEGRVVQMADVHTTQEFKTLILRDEAQAENEEFLNNLDENIQTIIKEQVKEQALVEVYESDKIILDTHGDIVTLKRRRDDDADKDKEPSAGSDRGSKRRREGKEPKSTSALREKATRTTGKSTQGSKSQQKTTSESASAEKPMQTTHDLEEPSHQEFVTDTLTSDLLAGPTYELMKGSCKSLVELGFFLEEVYTVTTDQLDYNNPEGQQYLHNLLKPIPLIPNSRGRHVILFDHFINNDLEYLCGGTFSRKYTTSVTKTKATDYGHVKWIEDLVPRTMWSQEPITVCRDDDKLYKFKEGEFKRLRIQDIEDMLLLLVQGKLTNLTVEESFAFNVSLRMFTRSIVIQRHMEDLQLGVESYQKKLNLKRMDTYRSDLNDGTLNDVRTALDDRLKGIRMKYLPLTIWRKSDKERAAAMIQAIDKQLKTRRIMRSLEKFIGGRLYEGDFRMLQRT